MSWTHKDEWTHQARDMSYAVMVSRHDGYSERNPNGWCVYAFVRRQHPLFDAIHAQAHKPYYEIAEVDTMPLHGGCTYFKPICYTEDGDGKYGRDYKKGDVFAYQIGCDYSHIHDDHYAQMSTKEHASCIFSDAMELFNTLGTAALPKSSP